MKRLILTLAAILFAATSANAYVLSCRDVRNAFVNGPQTLRDAVTGHVFGVVDMMTAIYCFVGHPQCGCLSNLIRNRAGEVGAEFGSLINQCVNSGRGDEPAVGRAIVTVGRFCPL